MRILLRCFQKEQMFKIVLFINIYTFFYEQLFNYIKKTSMKSIMH
jgi:hypothetical protein